MGHEREVDSWYFWLVVGTLDIGWKGNVSYLEKSLFIVIGTGRWWGPIQVQKGHHTSYWLCVIFTHMYYIVIVGDRDPNKYKNVIVHHSPHAS